MSGGCLGNELAEAGHSVPELQCVDFMNASVRIFRLLPVDSGCLRHKAAGWLQSFCVLARLQYCLCANVLV